jgi:hypothetical protein
LSITGIDENVGDGGYEITLADNAIESHGTVWIQLKDAEGQNISPKIYLETASTCDGNLVLLNFVADQGQSPAPEVIFYFPLVFKE